MRKRRSWFRLILLTIAFAFSIGYFLFNTATTPAPPPLLRLHPYQHFLSLLKIAGPTVVSFFQGWKEPVAILPYSFFETPVLVTALSLLFILTLGLFLKGRSTLYLGVLWFFLTLSPLLYQPTFGQISLAEPPYLPTVGLFLVLWFLTVKFVSK